MIVFLNGPPKSGKDTAAELLCANHDFFPMKFASPLKAGLACLLGLNESEYFHYFESPAKEECQPPFSKHTPRECLIDLSEEFMKDHFGPEIFGQVAANQIEELTGEQGFTGDFVFSDCGFDEEVWPVINYYGAGNCLVVTLHRDGCSFEGDSREYLTPSLLGGVKFKRVNNNGSIDDLRNAMDSVVAGL